MNELEILFKEKGIYRYGLTLYSKRNALEFIIKCKEFGIVILGIDAFFVSDIGTQPSMENSIDYSKIKEIDSIYEKALTFVKDKSDNLYFEIVCK